MSKKILAEALWCAMGLCLLAGCSPSPTAVTVGSQKVDASEYVFYLYYNRSNIGEDNGTVLYDEAANLRAREAAVSQIVSNEVVRLKCKEFGLELSESQREALKQSKQELQESLGGTAAYLEYLEQSMLTDRAYDKFQENSYYYNLLYDYVAQDSRSYFTDEVLRKYFSENYAVVKYIFISYLDDEGEDYDPQTMDERKRKIPEICQAAQAEGADFDALMAQYNEDILMTAGYPISRMEAESTEYLTILFELEENQVSDPIEMYDGCYILKRCPVSASYYDENQADIFQAARDNRFDQMMDEWREEYPVTQEAIVEKINLSNLREYLK